MPHSHHSVTKIIKGISVTKKVFTTFIEGISVTEKYLLHSSKVKASQKGINVLHQTYQCQKKVFNLLCSPKVKCHKKVFTMFIKGTSVAKGYLLSSSKVLVWQTYLASNQRLLWANSWMQKWIVVTVKRYSHQTLLQEFVDAMPNCGNAFFFF